MGDRQSWRTIRLDAIEQNSNLKAFPDSNAKYVRPTLQVKFASKLLNCAVLKNLAAGMSRTVWQPGAIFPLVRFITQESIVLRIPILMVESFITRIPRAWGPTGNAPSNHFSIHGGNMKRTFVQAAAFTILLASLAGVIHAATATAEDMTTTNANGSIVASPKATTSFAAYHQPEVPPTAPSPKPGMPAASAPSMPSAPSPAGSGATSSSHCKSCDGSGGCDCGDACCKTDDCGGHGDCLAEALDAMHGGVWHFGAEAVWARPYFQRNTAYTESISTGTNTGVTQTFTQVPFVYDFEVTPRIWLAYEDPCGFGFRGRYWQYDQNAHDIAASSTQGKISTPIYSSLGFTIPDSFSNQGSFSSGLELHVTDIEATQRFDWCSTDAQFGWGVRIVRLEHTYDADFAVQIDDFYRHSHQFDGAGPTVAIDLRRPIGCTDFSFLAGARAAVLVGQVHDEIALEIEGDATINQFVHRNGAEVLASGEVNFGIEWRTCLSPGTDLVATLMVEGQAWHGAGNAFESTGDIGFLGLGSSIAICR